MIISQVAAWTVNKCIIKSILQAHQKLKDLRKGRQYPKLTSRQAYNVVSFKCRTQEVYIILNGLLVAGKWSCDELLVEWVNQLKASEHLTQLLQSKTEIWKDFIYLILHTGKYANIEQWLYRTRTSAVQIINGDGSVYEKSRHCFCEYIQTIYLQIKSISCHCFCE